MSFFVSVAWRNLWRHRRRSLITATAMAVGLALCMAMIAFSDGTFAQMFDVMVRQQLGHVQVHHPDYPGRRSLHDTVADSEDLLARLRAHEQVSAASPRLNGFALVGSEQKSTGGQVVGVEPRAFASVTKLADRVVEGSYLSEEPDGAVLIGDGLASSVGLGVGDELIAVTQAADGSLGNDLYTVRGVVHTGSTAMDRAGVYMHLQDAQRLLVLPDQVHQILVLGTRDDRVEDLAAEVEGLAGPDLDVRTWREASPQTAQMMGMQDVSAFIMLGFVFSVAAFGVLNTMLMSVFERTRELGVLKALGIRPWRLVVLVLVESLFLAALAGGIGLVLGGLLDAWLVVYGVDFSGTLEEGFDFAGVSFEPVFKGLVRPHMIALCVLALFVVALLASMWPALRAAALQPVESLRAE